jgi:hypothetical protein
MKKLISNFAAFMFNAKVHADHSAIKGNKSGGSADANTYQHWRTTGGDTN